MSDHGIEVLNRNGLIQFSTEAQSLYAKLIDGSVTIGARANQASETAVNVNVTTAINNIISGLSGSDVIVAFRPTAAGTVYGRLNSSTVGRFSFYNLSFSSVTVEYCVFVKAEKYTTFSGHGINVFESDGTTLKYSTNYPPASIETILSLNLATASTVSYTYDDSVGYPWALITSGQGVTFGNQFAFEPDQSGFGVGEWQVNGITWTNTVIKSEPIEFLDNNITQASFYDKVGATYTSAKLVVLRGYDYT
jgi:hypothetical protein